MTIAYNVTARKIQHYIVEQLKFVEDDKVNKLCWYYQQTHEKSETLINYNDIRLLVSCLRDIVFNDFEKIKKLTQYLKKTAIIFYELELAITWNLPSGLKVVKSYMFTETTVNMPFT